MRSEILRVTGMTNDINATTIEQALKAMGVDEVNVSVTLSEVSVKFDKQSVSSEQVRNALTGAGLVVVGVRSAHANGSCCGACGG